MAEPTADDLKKAFKAFKKRLKLTQLDEESRVNKSPVTSGRGSGIVAMAPPNDWPEEVWLELVKQGKLKKAGRGMYEVVEER